MSKDAVKNSKVVLMVTRAQHREWTRKAKAGDVSLAELIRQLVKQGLAVKNNAE